MPGSNETTRDDIGKNWSHESYIGDVKGIDTNIEVVVVSLTTWEAHHSPVVSFPGR